MGPDSTFRKIHSVRIKLNCKTPASAAELLVVGKAPHTSGVETKENCLFGFFLKHLGCLIFSSSSSSLLRGYSAGDPTCATWVCRLFQPEGKEVPKDSERNFELLPNCLREQNIQPVLGGRYH